MTAEVGGCRHPQVSRPVASRTRELSYPSFPFRNRSVPGTFVMNSIGKLLGEEGQDILLGLQGGKRLPALIRKEEGAGERTVLVALAAAGYFASRMIRS